MRRTDSPSSHITTLTVRLLALALVASGCVTAVATPSAADGPAALTVTNPSLVFIEGSTSITISSDQAAAGWSVANADGEQVRSGTTSITDGAGRIRLQSLKPGYYALTVHAGSGTEETTRSTSIAVLAPLPKPNGLDQRFGVGMHLHSGMNVSWLQDAAKVGYGEVRTDISWSQVEVTKGVYTYPAAADAAIAELHTLGIKPMLLADYGNKYYDNATTPSSPQAQQAFANYASDLLTHYETDTDQVEVFNEFNGSWFNNGSCGTTADCYLPLLQATYSRVKADHPRSVVAGPAIYGAGTSWVSRLFQLGGLKDLNAVTYHDYTYPQQPEGKTDIDAAAMRATIDAAGGTNIPLWITEIGWPTATGVDTEPQQADYIVRAEALAFGNGVSKFFWYDWVNDTSDPTADGANFGLLNQPMAGVTAPSPKPDLVTQSVLIRELNGLAYSGRDEIGSGAYSYRFGSGGKTRRMLWTTDGGSQTVTLKATAPITVTDEYGKRTVYHPSRGQVRLTISQHPVYASGAILGVTTQ